MSEEDFDGTDLFAAFEEDEKDNKNEFDASKEKRNRMKIDESELDLLRRENIQLKNVLRKIASRCQPDENPVASIMYFNYGNSASIEQLMKQFASSRDRRRKHDYDEVSDGELSYENHSSFRDTFALALGEYSVPSQQKDSNSDIQGLPLGSVQYFTSYCLDSFGSTVVNLSSSEDRPKYEQVYFKVLPDDGQGGNKLRRARGTCFNCDGDHMLQDCPKPRDLARINAKRQEFNANSSFSQEARYHDKEREKRFQHFVPGKITDELREALGTSNSDLPPYIYRMRMLDYPPGWLPSNHDSGIVIHGKEGKADESVSEEKKKDEDELVRFPGFNSQLPKGVNDLANQLPLPRMDLRHLLSVKTDDETPDRKHRRSPDMVDKHRKTKRRRRCESDMDIDSDNDNTDRNLGSENLETPYSPKLPLHVPWTDTLEEGELPDSPGAEQTDDPEIAPSWWFKEPMVSNGAKSDKELIPPPFPLRPLPLHKISQILPGEMNHISFEDRNLWLDPVFGNLQIRTGRYDRLKTILACRQKAK